MAPLNAEGYWGKPTSTIDWCENNYEFSFYIAEMTNTISNLMMILPPLWGMLEVVKQGFQKRFIYCHFLLLIVGLGSWAFHMTLLYEMQLFDELPMVWGTCVLVYCLRQVRKLPGEGLIDNPPLLLFLSTYAILFTVLYLYWPQPLLQHSTYGILVIASFVLELSILREKQCRVCKQLFFLSTTIYMLGFFLWNIDNVFCTNLQAFRERIPTILNPLTQLHGWWHFMAGYGTYLQVLFTMKYNNPFNPS